MMHEEMRELPRGSVNIAENRLVTAGWSEIMGGYNTADTVIEIGPTK